MELDNIITELIYLPRKLKNIGTVSIYTLLKEIGYFKIYEQISEKDIIVALTNHPECIEEWILYSEDKRCSPSWCLEQDDDGSYIVGYYDTKSRSHTQKKYSDIVKATAIFIKHEIEHIRQS